MSDSSQQYVIDGDIPTDRAVTEDRLTPGVDGSETKTPSGEEPSVDDILRIVFDMGVCERRIYDALTEREHGSATELAEELDRHRSNVNRNLNELFQKGFVTRRRRILKSGGQMYQYSARPPAEIRTLLLAGLQEWTAAARDRIDDFAPDDGSSTDPDRAATPRSAGHRQR